MGSDPASDSTDWAYCGGTPTLGYTPFSTTGSLPPSFATSSSQTLLSYTFNADDAQTISSLSVTVSGLSGSEACVNGGTPSCALIDEESLSNCTKTQGQNYTCPVPAAAMNVTLSDGATESQLEQSIPTVANSFPYAHIAGHTLTLKVMNPSSTGTDSISSGSWTL